MKLHRFELAFEQSASLLRPSWLQRFVQFSWEGRPAVEYRWLDMLRAADESLKLETALSSSVHQWLELLAAARLTVDLAT